MGAGQRQQGQTAAQGRAEVDLARHGLIGQFGDLGPDRFGVRIARECDVGKRLKRLDADEGRIEIEDERGGLGHAALSTRSGVEAATMIAKLRA